MKITFYGAANEVTGSQHLVETDHHRFLLDCGFFQGHRAECRAKNEKFQCNPKDLDAVFLSHAHIDHCGNLPGLYRAGFRGPVFCTPATAEVAEIMLLDSARIQAEDAKFLSKRLRNVKHPPFEPLYGEDEVRKVAKLFEPIPYGEKHALSQHCAVTLFDAGHILGSAIMRFNLRDDDDIKRLVFTGDLGRRGMPLLNDPQTLDGCDILIGESTYGNRAHPPAPDVQKDLERIIKQAAIDHGKVIIPAFSLGRTQQIIYFLNELANNGDIPKIPMFVDSPLASRLTRVFERHQHLLDAEAQRHLRRDDNLFHFPGLQFVKTRQESQQLNDFEGPCVIISASGMCESGRVVHHLAHSVQEEKNTIVIIGYQARHTLGRRIVERQPYLKIMNREYPLKAKVEKLNGLSGHADVVDLKWWYEKLAGEEGIGQAFLVHGENSALENLAGIIHDFCNTDPIIPERGQTFEA